MCILILIKLDLLKDNCNISDFSIYPRLWKQQPPENYK